MDRARQNAAKAGHKDLIHFHLSSGTACLQSSIDNNLQFDFIFIDADKHNFAHYYQEIIGKNLLSPNGILCFDNTLWRGSVLSQDEQSPDFTAKVATALDKSEKTSSNGSSRSTTPLSFSMKQSKEQLLHDFNVMVAKDSRTVKSLLPIRDGLTLISWAPRSL